jgi:hypothetical protein
MCARLKVSARGPNIVFDKELTPESDLKWLKAPSHGLDRLVPVCAPRLV